MNCRRSRYTGISGTSSLTPCTPVKKMTKKLQKKLKQTEEKKARSINDHPSMVTLSAEDSRQCDAKKRTDDVGVNVFIFLTAGSIGRVQ